MSDTVRDYQHAVTKIMRGVEKELGDKYEENIFLGKQSLIKDFLDGLVSCGEMTEINRQRIEENPDLKEWFQQPAEMDLDDELESSDEEDEVFRGRTTFPDKKSSETLDFIKDYIEKEWPELSVKRPDNCTPQWINTENRYIINRAPDIGKGFILHCGPSSSAPPDTRTHQVYLKMAGKLTGANNDGKTFTVSLLGEKFKVLDEWLCVL